MDTLTPVLTGKDAEEFIEKAEKASKDDVSLEEVLEAKRLYEALFKRKKF